MYTKAAATHFWCPRFLCLRQPSTLLKKHVSLLFFLVLIRLTLQRLIPSETNIFQCVCVCVVGVQVFPGEGQMLIPIETIALFLSVPLFPPLDQPMQSAVIFSNMYDASCE